MTDTTGDRLVLVLSDLHFGKWVQPEKHRTAMGYDLDIADARVRSIPSQLADRPAPAELTVLLGGDLVEGSGIFGYQEAVNDDHPLQQVAMCIGALWHMLTECVRLWPNTPIRVRSVRGNHGRLNKFTDPRANWDNQIVHRLAELSINSGQIDVEPNYGLSCVVPVGQWKLALIHRAEKHGSSNAMLARVLRRLRHYRADLLVCGHWHTPGFYEMDGDPVLLTNGCLCGPDEYSEQLGAFGPPRQALLTVNDRLGPVEWLEW